MTQPVPGYTAAQLADEWRKVDPEGVAALERSAAALELAPKTDWTAYRKCNQVCRAEIGEPCFSLSGRIIDGRPDNIRRDLDVPHKARRRRRGR